GRRGADGSGRTGHLPAEAADGIRESDGTMKSHFRRIHLLIAALAAASAAGAGSAGAQDPAARAPYDIVIRHGRVRDGNGIPWIAADVAIRDGRFVKIGVIPERGTREIDATGRYVSPGWIDVMDQSGNALR